MGNKAPLSYAVVMVLILQVSLCCIKGRLPAGILRTFVMQILKPIEHRDNSGLCRNQEDIIVQEEIL